MRIVVYGVGAVGGTIAARLVLSGKEVVGIARGRMLEAIRTNGGLRLRSPRGDEFARFACYGDPGEIALRPDDIIVLAVKSQDTAGAIERLLAAGAYHQPIVCAQNGAANERVMLRHFPNVYGMVVMLPAQYSTPAQVEAFGAPRFGLFDIGRYPTGLDATTNVLCNMFNAAEFDCEAHADVMANKYGKLLINVGNMVGAALGREARSGKWYAAARQEAEAVYQAAGIAFNSVDFDISRRDLMRAGAIPGVPRLGSSSFQSLLRNAGSLETDYLNGEIALLGRLHDVPTPVNAALCRIARRMLQEGIAPGEFPPEAFEAVVAES